MALYYWPMGPPEPPAPDYFVGVDLAQANDYTAVAVLERTEPVRMANGFITPSGAPPVYAVRHLDRWRGRSYLDVGTYLRGLVATLRQQSPRSQIDVVLDGTGVGAAVVDTVRDAGIAADAISAIIIHGGNRVITAGGTYRVPKADLVAAVAVALQGDRLKIAAGLALASVLTAELGNFKSKLNPATMHESYGAWREADHDDMVLSVAMAVWLAEDQAGAGQAGGW